MSRVLFLNGKFCVQALTGVQRVATELVLGLDAVLDAQTRAGQAAPGEVVLLCPPGARSLQLRHVRQQVVGRAGQSLTGWEQWVLPRQARRGLLLNLSGSAPWLAARAGILIHDAAIWDQAPNYSPVFRYWYRSLFWAQARRGARLFTVSEFSRQRLADRLGLSAQALDLLPNGSDHLQRVKPDYGILDSLGLRAGQAFVLAVGSASRSKNLAMLWHAYQLSGLGPARPLVWVGDSNARVFGRSAVTQLPPGVVAAGRLGDGALRALYACASALAFPSRHEGFGLPVVEAAREGCPVLLADAPSLRAIYGPEWACLPVDDVHAWAHALKEAATDEVVRQRWRQRAEARAAVVNHTWASSAAQLLKAWSQRP